MVRPALVRIRGEYRAYIERLLTLEWWKYDLAPHKHDIDFSNIEAALEVIEDKLAQGVLSLLQPVLQGNAPSAPPSAFACPT